MAQAREFMHTYSLPNYKWFESGIETASDKQTNRVYANTVVSFPKVSLKDVQQAWQSKGEDFKVDTRVFSSVEIENKYAPYAATQNKMAESLAN